MNTYSRLEQGVADMLTGDPIYGDVPYEAARNRFDVQGLMYYLYLLNQTGRLGEVLGEVYENDFRQTPAEEGAEPDATLTPVNNVVQQIATLSTPGTAREVKSAAKATVLAILTEYRDMAASLNIPLTGFFANLEIWIDNPNGALLDSIKDIPRALRSLAAQIKQAQRREQKKIPKGVSGHVVTYLCLRREHELAGITAQKTTKAALHDLAEFAVGAGSDDFGEFSWGDALRSGKAELLKDIIRVTAKSVLEKFPCTKELPLNADEHVVEHHLESMPAPLLAILIHYLGQEAPKLKTNAAVKLGKLVRHMEELLAKKIENELKKIPEAELPHRLHEVLDENLYEPIKSLQKKDGPHRAEEALRDGMADHHKVVHDWKHIEPAKGQHPKEEALVRREELYEGFKTAGIIAGVWYAIKRLLGETVDRDDKEAIARREGLHEGLKIATISSLIAYWIKKIFGEKDDRKDR